MSTAKKAISELLAESSASKKMGSLDTTRADCEIASASYLIIYAPRREQAVDVAHDNQWHENWLEKYGNKEKEGKGLPIKFGQKTIAELSK